MIYFLQEFIHICNMLLLYTLMVWHLQAIAQNSLNMYNTNNQQDAYCLLSYFTSTFSDNTNPISISINTHQAISYCLRAAEKENPTGDLKYRNTIDTGFTFTELREKNVTSDMLLSWFAPIDLSEQYQIFLNNNSNGSSEDELLFYNCTSAWFGPFCRFMFESGGFSFDNALGLSLQSRPRIIKGAKVTCYQHLHCQTALSCLDWREICDGKSDCLDGSDEINCWQLEVNECDDNEFECHNGQCIPFEFFHEIPNIPDCLDRTDESLRTFSLAGCYRNPTFQCEEHTCPPGVLQFSCGDGECTNGITKCYNGRNSLLSGDFCSNTTACSLKLYDQVDGEWCQKFCSMTRCMKESCPMLYEFLTLSPLLGHVRFLYSNKEVEPDKFSVPDHVCYDEALCKDFLPAAVYFGNLTCRHFHDLQLKNIDSYRNLQQLVADVKYRFLGCLIVTNDKHYCNYSTMYQCRNSSKCISKQRLLDGIRDCPFDDDETFNQSCSLNDARQRFRCLFDDKERCLVSLVVRDGKADCINSIDEKSAGDHLLHTHIYFQNICNGPSELPSVLIDEKNETDETHCESWPCNNTYTRCDGFWSCKDGADEINCTPSICPEGQHSCVLRNDTTKVSCLSAAQAGDGIDHCLGGLDERTKYYRQSPPNPITPGFHCWNDTKSIGMPQLCNRKTDCLFNDDESFCTSFKSGKDVFCHNLEQSATDVDIFLCSFLQRYFHPRMLFFKLRNMPSYSLQHITDEIPITSMAETNTQLIEKDPMIRMMPEDHWRCNRGMQIRIRMDSNTSELSCLCPPSYYGDRCQYQNQRVSITLRIRVLSDWRSIFIFMITLIDNDRNIESQSYIEYSPTQDCDRKFNFYLLYSSRPKSSSKNYSVQIDAFNQLTLKYRASWIFPLLFPFLPVHRLPLLVTVPASTTKPMFTYWPTCMHGEYLYCDNNQNLKFCRCQPGWTGTQCNISYTCDCASGSLCISNSICLCPPGRFGLRCHLIRDACPPKLCLNGGHCVSTAWHHLSTRLRSQLCICQAGYVGDRCQHQQKQSRIDVSFQYKVTIPSSLLVHFIAVPEVKNYNRTSIMKKIGFSQYSLTIYTSVAFNIAFVQIFNIYYLIVLREQIITLAHISTEVAPSHRCQSIQELFNETFANQYLLKRIKYYHIPCEEQVKLVCFYDDVHLCLCTIDRQANCFNFDHNMTYDCGGYNLCEHEGHCFQDDPKCPTLSFCACQPCYFGSKCQFSTKGSTLSFDTILGYHIHSKNIISQQPLIVKATLVLTTVVFVFGFLNSFLSFMTFRGQETRNVGCGLYLYASSIISMSTMTIFTLKFFLFLASQMGSINNRSFLYIQCVSIDFALRVLLNTIDWLNACVAIERAVTVLKGISFDKAKSRQVAKWMIFIVILLTSFMYIYDPIHRRLIDDDEEQRTWCFSQYSLFMERFDWIMNIFHFSVPFIINCISASIIIVTVARTRSNSQKNKSFKKHLHKQLQNYKHLLVSPSILVALAVPRLIISFSSGCMKSARDSWFYLIGYFISLIPTMMTFVVFVLPSDVYKKEFRESIKRIYQQ